MMRRVPQLFASLAVVVAAGGFLAVSAARAPDLPRNGQPIELAITVDDLTRPPFEPAYQPPERVIDQLVAAFSRHHLPAVTGFLNGASIEGHPADEAAIERWVAAGNLLGNHTYSHLDLARVDVPAYLADIDRNESWLAKFAGAPVPGRDWRVFRYPFLQEGATESAREEVRAHLFARGYRIAEVTVDFDDWQWFPSYARCRASGSEREIDKLRTLYRESARKELLASDKLARQTFGRPIRQVLLLHAGAFTAEMIEDLLQEYEALGVRFVSLDEAIEDSAYRLDPRFARDWGSSYLSQVELSRGVELPAAPWPPHAELAALCH
jgi:peptidoglycan/xylan/chitin deacetylase (PgdA/CDA1 family)